MSSITCQLVVGVAVSLAVMWGGPARAETYYVDDSNPNPGNGQSWPAAFNSLQDALAEASVGGSHIILVAQGTYRPTTGTDRTISFQLIPDVQIEGGYIGYNAPDPDLHDPDLYVTVLSGDLAANDGPGFTNYSENSYNVVTTAAGVTESAVLKGFAIQGGNANAGGGGLNQRRGAGIRLGSESFDGSPQITGCTITKNSATSAGGGVSSMSAVAPLLRGCTVIGNRATGSGSSGGGVHVKKDGSIALVDCVLSQNTATGPGGAGGGAWLEAHGSAADLVCCTLGSNMAAYGGALAATGSHPAVALPTMVNCLVADNQATIDGGAFHLLDATMSMVNCTVSQNTAPLAEAYWEGTSGEGTQSTITNSIFWDNGDSAQFAHEGVGQGVTVNFSDIEGGWNGPGGTGNIDADPLFVNPAAGDFRLKADPCSPAVEAGSNAALPSDEFDADGDTVTNEKTPDRARLPRIIGQLVDMGAYEQPAGECNCAADVDRDGHVYVNDLVALFMDWGCTDPPGPCEGDINGDGVVGVADLTQLFLNWGELCELQEAPASFWQCIERCGPTDPNCIVGCGELFGLFD
jgi:hypothetical protein